MKTVLANKYRLTQGRATMVFHKEFWNSIWDYCSFVVNVLSRAQRFYCGCICVPLWLTAQWTTENKGELLWLCWRLSSLEPLRVALIISFDAMFEKKSALFLFGPSFSLSFQVKNALLSHMQKKFLPQGRQLSMKGGKKSWVKLTVRSNSDLLGDNPCSQILKP